MLIQLFRAASSYPEAVFDKWMVPLDLCSLATFLKSEIPEIEIDIQDGQIISNNNLLSKINTEASIVGVTYTIFSVNSMERIAEIAKKNGAFVVVGGHAATASAENLLRNSNIDAVIKYDGEIPLSLLAKKIKSNDKLSLNDIPNIVYRSSNGNNFGPRVTFDVNRLPTPSRDIAGINIENYIQAFPGTCTEKKLNALRPTNAYSKKGCPRSCSFCGRMDKQFRPRAAEIVYKEFAELCSNYHVDYIYDHSDTWIEDNWIKEFMDQYDKFGSLNLRYMIFGDVRDINKNVAKRLRKLGVDIVLLGLESGSESLLRKNGKNIEINHMKACIAMLAEEDIKVSASFVLGMIDETNETLKDTISFISEIKYLGDVTIYCNLIIPLPGSWQWEMMMKDNLIAARYKHKYKFDIDKLREVYINRFTKISGGMQYLKEIRDMILIENNMPILEYAR